MKLSPGVNLINIFLRTFFAQKSFLAAFSICVLALAKKILQKMRVYNVNEIDSSNQFHQNFTQVFLVQKCFAQLFYYYYMAL